MACGETGARAAAVELKDTWVGTAPGVALDAMLTVGTLSGTVTGGTLDGIVAGGVAVIKEVAGTLDGTVVCGVDVVTEAIVAVDAAVHVGTEAVGALESTVAGGAVKDDTGVDGVPEGMLTDGAMEEDTLAVGTLSGTAAGGTLDGIVAGGVAVIKEVAGTLDGAGICSVVVGIEALDALESTVAGGAVKDGTGADGVPEGILTDGAMGEDTLAVGSTHECKFLFLRWYVDHQLLI